MKDSYLAVATVLLAFACLSPASAHHSRAEFAGVPAIVFQGRVARFNWANPHVYIYVETKDDAGKPVEWEIVTDAIPILARNGWTPDSLKTGDIVTVKATPSRDPEKKHALLESIRTADGAVLTPRGQTAVPRVAAKAKDLSGTWQLPGGEDTGDFSKRWGAVALTEKGRAAKAAFRQEDRPAAKCIASPTPMIMAMPYLNQIELRDDRVIMRSEFFNVERTIYTDGRGHPENGERTNQGHSIGRWEGDTLVVDTTLFADHRAPIRGPNEGVPSGAQRHVVERYRLSEDRTRLLIDFTVEDPEYLAEPFTGTLQWVYAPQLKMMGFDCRL
jgi:hypothetical protein